MTEPVPAGSCRPPRCAQCGAPLLPASLPPGALGIAGDPCVECSDAAPARPSAWACPRCGAVQVFESPA